MADDAARHISRDGLAALEAELRQLETEGRRAIADRIGTAREWGDLTENAEYHDAKEAQAHLETKIRGCASCATTRSWSSRDRDVGAGRRPYR
jgi:transcription elongation GreA/GreB family factor